MASILRESAKKEYVVKIRKRDGTRGWQGGKNLAQSATWTKSFCLAIMRAWEAGREELGLAPGSEMKIIQIDID